MDPLDNRAYDETRMAPLHQPMPVRGDKGLSHSARGSALVICVVLFVVVCLLTLVFYPVWQRDLESRRRAECANNLNKLGLCYAMYARENEKGLFPPLAKAGGRLCVEPTSVYPKYLPNPEIMHCPSDDKRYDATLPPETLIMNSSYAYWGYALTKEDEMLAFLDMYIIPGRTGIDFTQDLPAPPGRGSFGGNTFVHLRSDLPNPSRIPVSYHELEYHAIGLYLDGHVEQFGDVPRFPFTGAIWQKLSLIK